MHDEEWFFLALAIIGGFVALWLIYYLYKLSKKKEAERIFWYAAVMITIAFVFLLNPDAASEFLGIPTLIGIGYFIWQFIKTDEQTSKLSSLLFAGALLFLGLSFKAYGVMEYIIPAVVLLAGGIVVEVKKLEK